MTQRKMCRTAFPVPLSRASSLISSSALRMGRRLAVYFCLFGVLVIGELVNVSGLWFCLSEWLNDSVDKRLN